MNQRKEAPQQTAAEAVKISPFSIPGHPLHTLRQENLAVETFIEGIFLNHLEKLGSCDGPELRQELLQDVKTLSEVERHYKRIEVLLLPFLEELGQIAPAKIMTAIHADVLRMIRDLRDDLLLSDSEPNGIRAFAAFLIRDIQIIMRQERDAYTDLAQLIISGTEWEEIANASGPFGYCMIAPPPAWPPEKSEN